MTDIGQPVYNEDTLEYEFTVVKTALSQYNVWAYCHLYDYPFITKWSSNNVDIEITCGSETVLETDETATVVEEICLGGSTDDVPVKCGDSWTAQIAPGVATSFTHSLVGYFISDEPILCPVETMEAY